MLFFTQIGNFVPKMPFFDAVPFLTEISKSTVKKGLYILFFNFIFKDG